MIWTRISHQSTRTTYGQSMWRHILADQLEVSEDEFWQCAREGVLPDRGQPSQAPPQSIPAEILLALVNRFHLPESEVKLMTREQAIAEAMRRYQEGD